MKSTFNLLSRILLLFLLLFTFSLATPSAVMAQSDNNDDQIVLGGNFRLQSDETLAGDLIVLGGSAILEEGSRVEGNVLITGGNLEVSGTIDGNITALGGTINLFDEAVVKGDINLISTNFTQSPGAVIAGNIHDNVADLSALDLDKLPSVVLPEPDITSPFRAGFNLFTTLAWAVLKMLAVSALAALVVLLAPKPTERAAESMSRQPLIAFSFGLLTIIVAPALLILLTITIILIPIGLIGFLILAIAGLFGWIAIGFEIGKRMEKALNQNWAPALTGGIGTLALTLVTSIISAVPCIGWIVAGLVIITGIGGVLISRFGTQVYGTSPTVHPTATVVTLPEEQKETPPVEGQPLEDETPKGEPEKNP